MELHHTETEQRIYEQLCLDLGEQILECLGDERIHEVLVNADGKVWTDGAQGKICIGELNAHRRLAIIQLMASKDNQLAHAAQPILEAKMPVFNALNAQRFTGLVPPIVSAPAFAIRKPYGAALSLDDYVASGRATVQQMTVLRQALHERKNILVCGGPGSGKTTVANALLQAAVTMDSQQRFIILEDLPELSCSAGNQLALLTSENVDMRGLLRATLRLSPDRIMVGEVRGAEALDMLKAWNTGCPGGICTVHANGVKEAVQRILDLALEAGLTRPPYNLVEQTIDVIVSIGRRGAQKGFIGDVVKILARQKANFIFESLTSGEKLL